MTRVVRLLLLRGVCQTPAYAALELGYFAEEGLDMRWEVLPTAWAAPARLGADDGDAAVIPWTRVAQAAAAGPSPMRVLCGSGVEEAAVVVRTGVDIDRVTSVAIPREGGMKDLTAMALLESLGWDRVRQLRFPSGDAAILSFLGGVADAAAMVEPYATFCEQSGVGQVIRRTGDVWPGAPGCSLAAATRFVDTHPEAAAGLVRAYARGAAFVLNSPAEAAALSAPIIGIRADYIEHALLVNRPDVFAPRNHAPMQAVLDLMLRRRYLERMPAPFVDLRFLDAFAGP